MVFPSNSLLNWRFKLLASRCISLCRSYYLVLLAVLIVGSRDPSCPGSFQISSFYTLSRDARVCSVASHSVDSRLALLGRGRGGCGESGRVRNVLGRSVLIRLIE